MIDGYYHVLLHTPNSGGNLSPGDPLFVLELHSCTTTVTVIEYISAISGSPLATSYSNKLLFQTDNYLLAVANYDIFGNGCLPHAFNLTLAWM